MLDLINNINKQLSEILKPYKLEKQKLKEKREKILKRIEYVRDYKR